MRSLKKLLTSGFWAEQHVLIKVSIKISFSMDPKRWIHLLVVSVFQGSFIISGISDLVTTEFQKTVKDFKTPSN